MSASDEPAVGEAVRAAADRLRDAGLDEARLEAEILVRAAAGLSKEQLLAHPDSPLSPDARAELDTMLSRRLTREPLAYILGEAEFYSLTFRVTPAAIVPRPETEVLVEAAVTRARQTGARLLVDVGTGSGAIAVVLARELPEARVIAVDVSRAALALTRENCARHGVADRVSLVCGDLLSSLTVEADAIIANLPYVETGALSELQPEVRDFEPRGGLDGGYDGLDLIRRLAAEVRACLSPRGITALEVGAGQAAEVTKLLAAGGLERIEIVKDYAGFDRVVIGWRGSS